MKRLIRNIRLLVNTRETAAPLRGSSLAELPSIPNAYLYIEDGLIAAFGSMENLPAALARVTNSQEANGQFVLPAWCDSHTHLVFPASRENEFIDKIRGLTYAEIAARGGGILNSAARLHEMPEDELYRLAMMRLQDVSRTGTGAIEIKSGYGLSVEDELKMLGFDSFSKVRPLLVVYKWSRPAKLDSFLKNILLPPEYKQQIAALDHHPS